MQMRVLALHGFRTNAAILRLQIKALSTRLGDSWSIVCLDAPNEATGDVDAAVRTAFPQLIDKCFEWYNYNKREDGTYEYTNIERSIRLLRDVVLADSYDVLLGFSQGGCFATILTWLLERNLLDIPANKRWRSTVILNAPFPRGDYSQIQNDEIFGTPMILGFGRKDKLIDSSLWRLKNALRVDYEEGHAPPRMQQSVDDVSAAILRHTARTWYAFDFDGVICDSAKETGTTAWLAAAGLIVGADGATAPSEKLIGDFCAARPLLETGYEALVILYRLTVMCQSPLSMLDSLTPAEDMESAWRAMDVSKEELKSRFQAAREAWIARDEKGWFEANGFYSETILAVRDLLARGESVYVITTKHSSFAKRLLEGCGISLAENRIFGLGSGPKRDVLALIAREREASLGGKCVFVEDRAETLRDVASKGQVPAMLVLAGYGYNTAHERKRCLEEDGFVVCPSQADLVRYLASQRTV